VAGQAARLGFTLAEVLITLGIIGVVTALTIPNLIANYKAIEMRTRLKTAYSLLSQAIQKMEVNDVSTNSGDYKSNTFQPVYIKHFNNPIDCGYYQHTINKPGCAYSNAIKYYNFTNSLYSQSSAGSLLDDGRFILSNGMLVMIENPGDNNIFISIDINGSLRKPNRWGYDLFTFQLINGELVPMGSQNTRYKNETYCSITSNDKVNGIACTAKALTDPDYFKKLPK